MVVDLFKSPQLSTGRLVFSNLIYQGSYRQVGVKIQGLFKDFSKLSYSFQGLKVYENPDLSVKILLKKCWTVIMEKLVQENQYKIVVPLFGAAYRHSNFKLN